MKPLTAATLAAAVPVASLVYYPDLLAPAAVVGALGALYAGWLYAHPGRVTTPTPPTITRMPSSYERGGWQGGWQPGLGLGFSLFHWPPRPFLFLTLFRIRRRR